MNTKEIEGLIEKYFTGETTLAEEKLLREFFSGSDIPEELAGYKPVFALFEEEQKEGITNPEFDRILFSKLSEDEGRVVSMVPRRTRIAYIASLAAAVVLLAGITATIILTVNPGRKFSSRDEMAYLQAQEALMIVSSNLNCGVSHVRYLKAFDKGMEKMQMLSKFYEYQSLIINPDEVQAASDKTTK
jgi:hypothetical protein